MKLFARAKNEGERGCGGEPGTQDGGKTWKPVVMPSDSPLANDQNNTMDIDVNP